MYKTARRDGVYPIDSFPIGEGIHL
jgi:hypothetical protein